MKAQKSGASIAVSIIRASAYSSQAYNSIRDRLTSEFFQEFN